MLSHSVLKPTQGIVSYIYMVLWLWKQLTGTTVGSDFWCHQACSASPHALEVVTVTSWLRRHSVNTPTSAPTHCSSLSCCVRNVRKRGRDRWQRVWLFALLWAKSLHQEDRLISLICNPCQLHQKDRQISLICNPCQLHQEDRQISLICNPCIKRTGRSRWYAVRAAKEQI